MRTFVVVLTMFSLLAGTVYSAHAQGPVTVSLHAIGGSHVYGTAALAPNGHGTSVFLRVRGLPAGAQARTLLNAGTCTDLKHLSASTAFLFDLRADSAGRASASGRVRYRALDVAMSVLTDGAHVILIRLPAGLVACGTVPRAL